MEIKSKMILDKILEDFFYEEETNFNYISNESIIDELYMPNESIIHDESIINEPFYEDVNDHIMINDLYMPNELIIHDSSYEESIEDDEPNEIFEYPIMLDDTYLLELEREGHDKKEDFTDKKVFEEIIFNKTNTNKNTKKEFTQDFYQRLQLILSLFLELYRVIISSLLIVFVPQSEDKPDGFATFSLVFNYFTLISFYPLYYTEIKRENRLIKYLEVNPKLSNDNQNVENMLLFLPNKKIVKIKKIDKQYQKIAYSVICVYGLNVLFSSIVILQNYIGSQTIIGLFTYVLFILTKLFNVYSVAHTEESIFLSAYLKSNIQYNDIDSKYKGINII